MKAFETMRQTGGLRAGEMSALFSSGLTSGVSAGLFFKAPLPLLAECSIFGLGIILSVTLVVAIRRRLDCSLEEALRNSVPTVSAISLLPLPFVSLTLQLILVIIFLLFSTLLMVSVIEAIVSGTRSSPVSSVLTHAILGFFCIVGFSSGSILYYLCFDLSSRELNIAIVIGTVTICSFLQAIGYCDEDAEKAEKHVESKKVCVSSNRSLWRTRVDYIAMQFDLSPRQREVIELLLKGRDTRYIMNHLYISKDTAKKHISNIYSKLDVHTREEFLDFFDIEEFDQD